MPRFQKTTILLIFNILFLLSACGGGNGGATGTTSNTKTLPMNIVFDELNIDAFEGFDEEIVNNLNVTVSQKIISQISATKKVYFVISQTNDSLANLGATVYSSYGTLDITTLPNSDFPLGSQTSTITVKGCWDANCSDQFGVDSVTYNLTIKDRAKATVESINMTSSKQETRPTLEIEVDFKELNISNDNWEVTGNYNGKYPEGWIDIAKSTENNSGNIELTFLDTQCGTHDANINISYTSSAGEESIDIPISYTLSSSLPVIENTYPQLHFVDKPIQFSVWGCGFESQDQNALEFDGLKIVNLTVHNDNHMSIEAEPINEEIELKINALPLENSNSELSLSIIEPKTPVVDIQNNPSQKNAKEIIEYDPILERIYFSAFTGNETLISVLSTRKENKEEFEEFPFGDAFDLIFSNDKKTLYAIYENRIDQFDAQTLTLIPGREYDQRYKNTELESAAATLDGNLIVVFDSISTTTSYQYDPRTERIHKVNKSTLWSRKNYVVSHDRGTIIERYERGGYPDNRIFNRKLGNRYREGEFLYSRNSPIIEMNDDGSRVLLDRVLYDQEWNRIADIPRTFELDSSLEYGGIIHLARFGTNKDEIYVFYGRSDDKKRVMVTYEITPEDLIDPIKVASIKIMNDIDINFRKAFFTEDNKSIFYINEDSVLNVISVSELFEN